MNNKKIRCVITDDEPLAREGLTGYVEQVDFLEIIDVCEDAFALSETLSNKKADLLFLDIQMPHLTGVEFLRSYIDPPKVIFTTAYEEYALAGFDLDVLDYLVKPISFERFLRAVNKARDFFNSRNNPDMANNNFIFVKAEGRLEKVLFNDVLYIESMENYLVIYTTNQRLIIHSTIKSFLGKLPTDFIQTHKSYIVPINRVQTIDGNMLIIDKYQVPVSRTLRAWVMEQIIRDNPYRY